MTRVLLVRHARAEPYGSVPDDAQRPLTEEGRARFARGVRGLERLDLALERVYTSPLLRALETAELMAPLLADTDGETVVAAGLGRPPAASLFDELEDASLALVGHEPWMGELCALLTTGRTAEGRCFPFKKGGAAWLEGSLAPGGMGVVAYLPPRVLRALAE